MGSRHASTSASRHASASHVCSSHGSSNANDDYGRTNANDDYGRTNANDDYGRTNANDDYGRTDDVRTNGWVHFRIIANDGIPCCGHQLWTPANNFLGRHQVLIAAPSLDYQFCDFALQERGPVLKCRVHQAVCGLALDIPTHLPPTSAGHEEEK